MVVEFTVALSVVLEAVALASSVALLVELEIEELAVVEEEELVALVVKFVPPTAELLLVILPVPVALVALLLVVALAVAFEMEELAEEEVLVAVAFAVPLVVLVAFEVLFVELEVLETTTA